MPSSIVWTTLIAVVAALAVLVTMVIRKRPAQGWAAWARENTRGGEGTSPLREHREAAEGETVPLADLLANAEEAPGYIVVPPAIEQGLEHLADRVGQRVGRIRAH